VVNWALSKMLTLPIDSKVQIESEHYSWLQRLRAVAKALISVCHGQCKRQECRRPSFVGSE
jgi:hypothetical protein